MYGRGDGVPLTLSECYELKLKVQELTSVNEKLFFSHMHKNSKMLCISII